MSLIPEIPPFETSPICSKCGSDRNALNHGSIEDNTEALKVTCERCGLCWQPLAAQVPLPVVEPDPNPTRCP